MITSTLETLPWVLSAGGGTITTGVGSKNLTGATGLAAKDLLFWTDDAGAAKCAQVDDPTGPPPTAYENADSVASNVAYQKVSVAAQYTPFFKGDNTQRKMPIIVPGAGPVGALTSTIILSSDGATKIDINQGVKIKNIYARFPYQYTLGDSQLKVGIFKMDSALANVDSASELGTTGRVYMTTENMPLEVNTFLNPYLTNAGTYWHLAATIDGAIANVAAAFNEFLTPNVSQLNAPDANNGLYIPIYMGVTIEHAIALTI